MESGRKDEKPDNVRIELGKSGVRIEVPRDLGERMAREVRSASNVAAEALREAGVSLREGMKGVVVVVDPKRDGVVDSSDVRVPPPADIRPDQRAHQPPPPPPPPPPAQAGPVQPPHPGIGPGAGPQWQHAPVEERNEPLTGGDIALLVVGLILAPIWLIIAIFASIGPLISTIGRMVPATLSSLFYLKVLALDSQDTPAKKARLRAMRNEAIADWNLVGRRFWHFCYRFLQPWGLGRMVRNMGRRISELRGRYEVYATQESDASHTPDEFRSRYHVLDQLPSGGSSGRVYVVRRAEGNPNEVFVLKHFDLSDGSRLEAVVRESQAVELARRLNLIVDSHLGEKSFYYVMPYYHGETLTKRVMDAFGEAKPEGLPEGTYTQTALGWVHQLLQIIAQYHDAGVIHKDIKPDNLIANGIYLHLVDIGLLTPLASLQQLTTHGTEYFRDPEMVRLALQKQAVRDVNATKFDTYAVGAVLYFCFQGDFPAQGSLSRFSRRVPRAVQLVVSRAMAPFEKRYTSARQMLADVDYLCWAASQGQLDAVRPADLPSFRSEGEMSMDDSSEAAVAHAPAYYPPMFGQAQPLPAGFADRAWYKRWRKGWRRREMGSREFVITLVAIIGGLVAMFLGMILDGVEEISRGGAVAEVDHDSSLIRAGSVLERLETLARTEARVAGTREIVADGATADEALRLQVAADARMLMEAITGTRQDQGPKSMVVVAENLADSAAADRIERTLCEAPVGWSGTWPLTKADAERLPMGEAAWVSEQAGSEKLRMDATTHHVAYARRLIQSGLQPTSMPLYLVLRRDGTIRAVHAGMDVTYTTVGGFGGR